MNFGKLVKTCLLAGLCTSVPFGDVFNAAQGAELKDPRAQPDNAGNRSLPLATLIGLIDAKKYADARALITSIKPTAVNRNLLHLWRGLTYNYASDLERAAAEFDQCTDLTETSAKGQLSIARTYLSLDQSPKSIKILNALLDKCPYRDHVFEEDCLEMKGDALATVGRFQEAVADYKHAVRLFPSKGPTLFTRAGDILRHQHKYSEALAILDEVDTTKLQQVDASYFLCRGGCLEELGKWSEATKNFATAIKMTQPGTQSAEYVQQATATRALLERAKCYDHMGKKELAQADRIMYKKLSKQAENEVFGQLK